MGEVRIRKGAGAASFFVWRKLRDSCMVHKSLSATRQIKKRLSIIIEMRSANCTKKSKGGHLEWV